VFVERLAEHLGHPTRDPHGDPIPAADGTFDPPPATVLWDASPATWHVARISDADPELLRYVQSVGLVLDAAVVVVERRDAVGVVSVRVGPDERAMELGEVAARAIWLVP
jgi:DtxR family Mn-dependent transcriptional regulator